MINKAYAFNSGNTIPGTIQIGNIAIAVGVIDYSTAHWYIGPDEDLGYCICGEYPIHQIQEIQFWRSKEMTEDSYLDLLHRNFHQTFSSMSDANIWLNNNGFYTTATEDSFVLIGGLDILLINDNENLIYK